MPYQINIIPQEHKLLHQFLSIALGGNSYLHPYIDEYYRKNEWEYYEFYQRSGLKGNPLFSMYTTKSGKWQEWWNGVTKNNNLPSSTN